MSLPIEEQHRLIEQWSGLITWARKRFRIWFRVLGGDEFHAIARFALVRAAERCDPDRVGTFKAFACEWIYRRLQKAYRRLMRRRDRELDWYFLGETQGLPDDNDIIALGVTDAPAAADARHDVATALAVLPPVWAYVVRRYYLDGALDREVAAELGVSRNACFLIRDKALAFLRAWAQGEGPRLRPADLANIERGKVHQYLVSTGKIPA